MTCNSLVYTLAETRHFDVLKLQVPMFQFKEVGLVAPKIFTMNTRKIFDCFLVVSAQIE